MVSLLLTPAAPSARSARSESVAVPGIDPKQNPPRSQYELSKRQMLAERLPARWVPGNETGHGYLGQSRSRAIKSGYAYPTRLKRVRVRVRGVPLLLQMYGV
jgi:hypothetical protein